jgi:HAD superfamily hydrolase (TIGR01458 family)
LNRAFRFLLAGAAFVTLARNRYYRGPDGLLLDQGPFVAALEYATGREAMLVGKPSREFYAAAVRNLGVAASHVAVVGDDIESDVGGGQAAGLRGILVRTGKFRQDDLARSPIRPDAVIGSLAEIGKAL